MHANQKLTVDIIIYIDGEMRFARKPLSHWPFIGFLKCVASGIFLLQLRNLLALKRRLHPVLDLDPRTRGLLALTLRIADTVPQEHHLDMTGRDAALPGAPAELPQRGVLSFLGLVLCVVEAGDVAEAEEGIFESVLVGKGARLAGRNGNGRWLLLTMVYKPS
jgi:hypothetical protein